jgi:DNA helicase TIP49 (TBP-interacting protein)
LAIDVVADARPKAPGKGLTVTTNAATPATIIAMATARVLGVDFFFICRTCS